ncbi:hypothetical protein [Kitasatospora purpeofusca]|uniref:hypothetical protein n=1 Tax=Kitasatospora purpeofusca TaxID=67352 RepID=UPI0038662A5B|nr:hypothetical protein OIP63_03915 [Kitasatospora purpeofusca]
MARQQYGSAARLSPKRAGVMPVPEGWTPLDDYRAAARTGPSVAEVLQRDAVRAHCVCAQCATRRSA